ncbi:MAG TPA: alpha/beta fold hydrolase [Phycisphaerae bacterium]|jgi:acylglycerol lipase|nr:alpha/beta hydrolase [Phycisphaerae bacterium]HOB76675.1 alpha/beta fold hydrolase [Phycisphaerae bacterium]HOJ56709.1 alpha/beta fold hydrolase [Phycisphaerae bacterium]HOL27177.1 alpha/beta fold hydrolase [Phycisphaerae bacterium]HPP22958.1 alpha/beta fold hydrolase [Phycisphaerae bacterium]
MLCCEPITLRYSDGYEGFARLWCPVKPRGAVLYLHGIQSHGGWFERSAAYLAEAGFVVLLPDRRGSGRNQRDRGHVSGPRRWLLDGVECLNELHVRTGFTRFHIVGVSWGGKLALALHRYAPGRIAGLSLIAPGLFPRVDLPFREKMRVAWSMIAARRTLFEIPLNEPELFTDTPAWRLFIQGDPLRLRQVTAAFLVSSRRLDRYVLGLARGHSGCPLHLFLAGRDQIIDNAATKAFVRGLNWPLAQITEYESACHTLEFEPDPGAFFDALAASAGGIASPISPARPC